MSEIERKKGEKNDKMIKKHSGTFTMGFFLSYFFFFLSFICEVFFYERQLLWVQSSGHWTIKVFIIILFFSFFQRFCELFFFFFGASVSVVKALLFSSFATADERKSSAI